MLPFQRPPVLNRSALPVRSTFVRPFALSLSAAFLGVLPLTSAAVPAFAQPARAPAPSEALPGATPISGAVQQLQEDAYILGPGDGLDLRFLVENGLSGAVEILNDGTASLPLLGSVRLVGLTLAQASVWLQGLYQRQLLRPDLQLVVSRPRPLRVAVVGEVERPGLYTLTTSEASRTEAAVTISGLPTLVDAIQKAGGVAAEADLRQVVLQRRLPGDTPLFKRTRVDLLALVRDGDQLQNPILFDGDTIRVLKAQESVREAIELSSTTLSPTVITVNVVGEVKGPGRIQVPANTPLIQTVLAAGGPVFWRANKADVELIRINRNGTASRERFQLNYGESPSTARNPPLREGDTVIVNRSALARTSDAIGAITTPITGLVNAWALVDLIQRRD
jgi:polysaccharide export outer membrane protein